MIKIIKKNITESYFKGTDYYNTIREYEFRITFLGLTIFVATENFKDNLIEPPKNGIGFKKKES